MSEVLDILQDIFYKYKGKKYHRNYFIKSTYYLQPAELRERAVSVQITEFTDISGGHWLRNKVFGGDRFHFSGFKIECVNL